MQYLRADVTARAYHRGYDDRFRGASRDDAASRRNQVDYVKEVTAVGEDVQAQLRYTPRRETARDEERTRQPAASLAAERQRDVGLSR